MPKRRTLNLTALFTVVAGLLVLPGLAAACAPSGNPDPVGTWTTEQTFSGKVSQDKAGGYIQVPFNVPANTSAVHIRYCYQSGSGNTMDIGVYEPLKNGDTYWGTSERRGWSGSAVKDLAIAKNGYSPAAVYENNSPNDRKKYVHGYTTRAYQAGAMPQGQWAVELGLGALVTEDPVSHKYEWSISVETTGDADWSNTPYSSVPYDPTPASTKAGWYIGDLHAHGEEEPGNALMSDDFNTAFTPKDQGGPGLDFMTLVDHNNDVAYGEIGRYQAAHPGKLIIRGTEVTTYHGHFNNQASGRFVDFRTGPVFVYVDNGGDGTYTQVRGSVPPREMFAEVIAAGGWAQVNHPAIYPPAPDAIGGNPACRGCFWEYSDADTDFSKTNAIEVQTGFASFVDDTGYNPFTQGAIDYYEHALDTGAHIAAVGSSDSHQNVHTQSGSDTPIGDAATVVHAQDLSEQGISNAVKGAHTYVKMYGPSGPDVRLTGVHPNVKGAKIIGDSMKAPSATFKVTVTGSGPGAARPGLQVLRFLKNGVEVAHKDITSDDFSTSFPSRGTGRYSVEIVRGPFSFIELYSSPIWFRKKAGSNKLVVKKIKANRKKGTAVASVKLPSTGKLSLSGKGARSVNLKVKKPSTLKLTIKPTGRARKSLARNGKAKVKAKFKFKPEGGKAKTATRTVKLIRKR